MAITRTTLSAACTATDLTLSVASTTGAAAGYPYKIDSEYGVIVSVDSATQVTVRGRGSQGTAAGAHLVLASVYFGPAADWPAAPGGAVNVDPPSQPNVQTIGASGAIPVPDEDFRVILDKASAAAMTIVNPSKGRDGQMGTIVAGTAQAHTVLNSTGFNAGGTTVDTATFGGAIGDNFTIIAVAGTWVVTNTLNVSLG